MKPGLLSLGRAVVQVIAAAFNVRERVSFRADLVECGANPDAYDSRCAVVCASRRCARMGII
jgi:hypothetical protein